MSLAWMAWTVPTASFFALVATALLTLTVLELRYPTRLRRGALGFATTRGDRFFVSLLIAGFTHAAWLAVTDAPVLWATGLTVVIGAGLMRWG